MPPSNYPGGFAYGVTIRGIPVLNLHSGNVFWVDSNGGSDGNKGTFDRPFATLDYAVGRCTANNGDLILAKAGHSEDPLVSITMDVAGVAIHGLGWGADRPTITFGALAAEFAMSAASCMVSNVRFDLGAVAATVTNAINVTGGSCIVQNCETVPHATSQFTNHLTATDAQFVEIIGNRFKSLHTASSTSGVVLDGCDDLKMVGNEISGHFTEHALDNTTPASVDEILRASIFYNSIRNWSATAGDLAVEMDANATGMCGFNAVAGGLALAANVDWGNLQMVENYLTDAADVHAVITPTTAAA